MSARQLLDQLLQSGQSLVKEASGHLQGSNGGQPARAQDRDAGGALGGLGNLLGSGSKSGGGLGSLLSGFGGRPMGLRKGIVIRVRGIAESPRTAQCLPQWRD